MIDNEWLGVDAAGVDLGRSWSRWPLPDAAWRRFLQRLRPHGARAARGAALLADRDGGARGEHAPGGTRGGARPAARAAARAGIRVSSAEQAGRWSSSRPAAATSSACSRWSPGSCGAALAVHVMTRPEGREPAEAAGARFVDLFAKYPLDAADADSIPLPSRLVSFAAVYAEPLIAEVAALRPALIVYDSFVVVAPLVARRLGIPYVGMRAGHAQVPARAIAETRADPRVATSAGVLGGGGAAAQRLRHAGRQPVLVPRWPQPPSESLRRAAALSGRRATARPSSRSRSSARSRPSCARELRPRGRWPAIAGVFASYVSFGTVIWRYYASQALAALARLAGDLSERGARVLISLGGHAASPVERRPLERPGVRVEHYVDQWGALRDADLFVTHHGLNSTHEAIFHRVPMLSYPFFGDQPAMARCCQRLGLAVALADTPRAELEAPRVQRAVGSVLEQREAFAARLAQARRWEIEVIAGREDVLDRVLALAGRSD